MRILTIEELLQVSGGCGRPKKVPSTKCAKSDKSMKSAKSPKSKKSCKAKSMKSDKMS